MGAHVARWSGDLSNPKAHTLTPLVTVRVAIFYTLYIIIWSVMFIEHWKQEESRAAFRWGVLGCDSAEQPMPGFCGVEDMTNPDTIT